MIATTDPAAPLDDLEPLRALVDGARVVAVGECAHHVKEFHLLRHRLVRFLVERCGFTVLGLESGFTEGIAVDQWVRGGGGDLAALAEHAISFRAGRCQEMREQLRWLRECNGRTGGRLRLSGLDVPGSAADLRPALRFTGRYLARVGSASAELLARLTEIADSFGGDQVVTALARYAEVPQARREQLTAGLGELLRGFAEHRQRWRTGGEEDFELAHRSLRGAWHLDRQFRGLLAATRGEPAFRGALPRAEMMAETVRWLADQDPAHRLIVLAHNVHVQRAPVEAAGRPVASLGMLLDASFGSAYRALGLTCQAGRLPDRVPGAKPLPPPRPDSVEAALAGVRSITVVDSGWLRARSGRPRCMRAGHDWTPVDDVPAAFDAIVTVPDVTTTAHMDKVSRMS